MEKLCKAILCPKMGCGCQAETEKKIGNSNFVYYYIHIYISCCPLASVASGCVRENHIRPKDAHETGIIRICSLFYSVGHYLVSPSLIPCKWIDVHHSLHALWSLQLNVVEKVASCRRLFHSLFHIPQPIDIIHIYLHTVWIVCALHLFHLLTP